MERCRSKQKNTLDSKFYFDIYKLRYYRLPQSGYRYLEDIMEDKEPSLGYHILARLLTWENQHNPVITTNFDSLTEIAIFLYSFRQPLVVNHESLADFVQLDVRRPVVAKVHRGAMFHPLNSTEDTNSLKEPWREALRRVFDTYIPVVVGYEGGDQSLMAFLQEKSIHFDHGIYWCYWEPSGQRPNDDILEFYHCQQI